MDRALEIAKFFKGVTSAEDVEAGQKLKTANPESENPSLSKPVPYVLIATVAVFHVIFAYTSTVAVFGFPLNPNPRVFLMLFGGSGATVVCVMALIKLIKCLQNWGWTVSAMALIGSEILVYNYENVLIFHVLLCSFTTLFIAYYMLLICGPDRADRTHFLLVIICLSSEWWVNSMFDKSDGRAVKFGFSLVAFVTSVGSQFSVVDDVKDQKRNGSLKMSGGNSADKS